MKDLEINFKQLEEWLHKCVEAKRETTRKKYRNLVVLACMPLVKQITYGIARRNTDPIEDLMQVGCVGLIKAVSSYDIKKCSAFRTYATQFITGEIRHYIRDKSLMIKPPRKIQELAYRICQITEELMQENGRKPTDVEIAERLQMGLEEVNTGMEVERRSQVVSLDYTGLMDEPEAADWYEKIPDEKDQYNQDIYEVRSLLKDAIEKLSPDLRELIDLYYFQCASQAMIAREQNLTNMQVSRKLKDAHAALYRIIQAMEREEINEAY